MDAMMDKLEIYLDALKKEGVQIPRNISVRGRPQIKVISAASGVAYKYLITSPFRRRIALAVKEIGLENQHAFATRQSILFARNHTLIETYIKKLEDNGLKLPANPKNLDTVYFEQVEIEIGVNAGTLTVKSNETNAVDKLRLREVVTSAAIRIGLDLRVLLKQSGCRAIQITYAYLMEKGTLERKQELENKLSADQQTYNTRSALTKFLKSLGLELTALVGKEFVTDFKQSIELVMGGVAKVSSRKKFQTEINWWQDFYLRLLKGQSIPDDFHQALTYLIDSSGLSHSMLARLIGVSRTSLELWYKDIQTPSTLSFTPIYRIEALFKLPAGTLVNKISHPIRRFRHTQLPKFLQVNPLFARQVIKHLPDDFIDKPLKRQQEIVDWIRDNILTCNDKTTQKIVNMQSLRYKLKVWPNSLEQEFESFASFKIATRPPIGMKRNGQWRPATKVLTRIGLEYFFGALCLPSNSPDIRLRGVGIPREHLSLALIACPLLVDWYTRFRCEIRNQYTDHIIAMLKNFKSMLRDGTGWLRQQPHMASRLVPISCGTTELVPADLVAKSQADWDGFCEEAISYYDHLINEISPLVSVSRDPFYRIEGIVSMDNPYRAFKMLIKGMKSDLPNSHTQSIRHHVKIRDCVLVILIAITGFRRNTIIQLEYEGGDIGHLTKREGSYLLDVPRTLFKNKDSSFFGPKGAKKDYFMVLPDTFGLYSLLSEYLNISRPLLLKNYHPDCKDKPLFVSSIRSKMARMLSENVSKIYREATEKHLVENKWRSTGIPQVRRHGPHSARHIRGTAVYKKTGSMQFAADANHQSERMAYRHYARFTTEDRNERIKKILLDEDD